MNRVSNRLRGQPAEILKKMPTHHITLSSFDYLPVLKLLHDETLGQRMRDEASANEDVLYSGCVTRVKRSGDEFLTHGVEQGSCHIFLLKVS